MESAFTGIEIGKRSLFAHQRALGTVGHNLSNAGTEGYSRQRVHFSATDPLYQPQLNRAETPGQIGQGVDIARIERVRDELLEGRIVANSSGEGYWEARDKYILQLEQVYNEPSELSVRTLMDRFWNSWQELSMYPDQMAARMTVAENGRALVNGISNRYTQLNQIRNVLNDQIQADVGQVNELTRRIAQLNETIVKAKAEKDSPNDLMDARDKLVNELSKIIDITVDQTDPDEYNIHTAGFHLVQGKFSRNFETRANPDNEGFVGVYWQDNGEQAFFKAGSLAAHIGLRDVDLRQEIQHLDNLAVNFVDMTNEVHTAGYGSTGKKGTEFFNQFPFVENVNGNYDRNGDGQLDASYVFRFTGTNSLEPQAPIGIKGTITLSGAKGPVNIDYFPTDTVSDVISRINNAGAEVVARLDRENRLSLKATPAANLPNPDFVIREVQDTGHFLVGYSGMLRESGAAGAYRWDKADAVAALRAGTDFGVSPLAHPSAWIGVNKEILKDPGNIATSFGRQGGPGEVGDGAAALAIASLRNSPVMVGQIGTFDDYFADRVVEVGLKGSESKLALDTFQKLMKDLRDQRESYSGVNIDEEMANMMKFQHGYNAAARFVSEVDKMLDVIINRMGV